MSPSRTPTPCTLREITGAPPCKLGASASNIKRMMAGTPAMTCTLPIEKPGAIWPLSISTAPRGIVAMRWRAALNLSDP